MVSFVLVYGILLLVLWTFAPQLRAYLAQNYLINGTIISCFTLTSGLIAYLLLRQQQGLRWLREYHNVIAANSLPEATGVSPARQPGAGSSKRSGDWPLFPAGCSNLYYQLQRGLQRGQLVSEVAESVCAEFEQHFEGQQQFVRFILSCLILLGLLGTFWGLLDTLQGFNGVIDQLKPDLGAGLLVSTLSSGISKPFSGMGTAFSSSLFGMSSALFLGCAALALRFSHEKFLQSLRDKLLPIVAATNVNLHALLHDGETLVGLVNHNIEAIKRLLHLTERNAELMASADSLIGSGGQQIVATMQQRMQQIDSILGKVLAGLHATITDLPDKKQHQLHLDHLAQIEQHLANANRQQGEIYAKFSASELEYQNNNPAPETWQPLLGEIRSLQGLLRQLNSNKQPDVTSQQK